MDLLQTKWRLLISINFINQRNEPHHEQEHNKISDTAKFPRNDRHLKETNGLTVVFYFQVF